MISKLLYIHKPSLTAVVQYKPNPNVEKIATVDLKTVCADLIGNNPQTTQPKAVIACRIKRLMRQQGVTIGDSTPEEMALWFIENHPQHLVERETD